MPDKLLVVDDDQAVGKLIGLILGGNGYSVLSATTAREAIELSKAHSGEISLLLADVVLPDMDGRQLARLLSGSNPSMKVLLMSGYGGDVDDIEGGQGFRCLAKPFRPEQLLRAVRQCLETP